MNDQGIREGMEVYSSDGERLGKVRVCDADGFIIEKGFFFPKEYFVRYAHATVSGDDIRLSLPKDQLGNAGEADLRYRQDDVLASDRELRDRDVREGDLGERDLGGAHTGQRASGDMRMTRAEEELDVVKRERQAGEVRLRKEVVTETKHIAVPVTREEVRVERTPVDAPRAAREGEARFADETISMPVVEEEVEIRKRPVVKEEVRLRRDRVQHEQRADAEVRREEIHVDDASSRTSDRGTGSGGLGAPGRDDDLP